MRSDIQLLKCFCHADRMVSAPSNCADMATMQAIRPSQLPCSLAHPSPARHQLYYHPHHHFQCDHSRHYHHKRRRCRKRRPLSWVESSWLTDKYQPIPYSQMSLDEVASSKAPTFYPLSPITHPTRLPPPLYPGGGRHIRGTGRRWKHILCVGLSKYLDIASIISGQCRVLIFLPDTVN